MPGFYPDGEYDLAGFAVGIVDKKKVINGKNIKAGDVLVGIKSSGVHSNGYSLVRKLFGDENKEISKVGVCMMPTVEVLKSAIEWGTDLLIVHEPMFYDHMENYEENSVVNAKIELAKNSGMTIFRYHDYLHFRNEDIITNSAVEKLELDGTLEPSGSLVCRILTLNTPMTSLELARRIEEKLGIDCVRIAGEKNKKSTKIATCFGSLGNIKSFIARDDVEIVLSGELCEWSDAEFARDACALGMNKSLIVLGHVLSERDGMEKLSKELATAHPELEVKYFECGDVYSYTKQLKSKRKHTISFEKKPDKDFKVLNLTDFQLMAGELSPENPKGKIFHYTLDTLIERVKPDLITVTGDVSWAGDYDALMVLGPIIDKYKIPWSVLWGNHDQERGLDRLDRSISYLRENEYFVYENGPMELGRGNYIIEICENGKPVHALFMMDSHNRMPKLGTGIENDSSWAKLVPEQIKWYKERVMELKTAGCSESTLLLHIPIYEYRKAFELAFKEGLDPKSITLEQSESGECWNEGYKDSVGVKYEDIGSYYEDDGVFEAIKEMGHTKNVICGHDHVNNYSINHEGVRLTFALKTGPGCYWNENLNGGTLLSINKDGELSVKHEYVDIKEIK